jgi:type IV pilus assembly protein PilN
VIRINLLPHREAKRKERRTYFMIVAFADVIVAVVVVGLVWAYFDQEISTQNQRNDFLKKENAKLDQEIEEIQKLKEETDRLLARKAVIERLQGDRSEPVILLDQLARRVPDGVYLRRIEPCNELQCGPGSIKITGYAQSSARVSTLMRNLDASPYMEGSELIEIKAEIVDKRRLNNFSLFFRMKRTATDDQKKKEQGKPLVAPAVIPAATGAPAVVVAPPPAAATPKAGTAPTSAAAPAANPAATPAPPPAPAPKK